MDKTRNRLLVPTVFPYAFQPTGNMEPVQTMLTCFAKATDHAMQALSRHPKGWSTPSLVQRDSKLRQRPKERRALAWRLIKFAKTEVSDCGHSRR